MADVNLNQFGVQCPINNNVFALRSKVLMMAEIEICKTLKLVCEMKKLLRKENLINVAKMSLNVDEIQFLNFMVSAKSLDACLENVKAVQEVQASVGKKSLQGFIGMIQYYRGYNFHGRKKFIDKKDCVSTENKGNSGECFGYRETGYHKNNCLKSGNRVKKIKSLVENAIRVKLLENMIGKLPEKDHSGEFVRRTKNLKNGTLVSDLKFKSCRVDCKAEFYLSVGISYGSKDVKFKPVVGLVDTGSTKCIILRSNAHLIGISCNFLHPKTYSLANNSSWRVLGEVEVQIKVSKSVVDVKVAVVHDYEVSHGRRTCIDGHPAKKILQYVSYSTKVLFQRLSQLQGATKFSNFDLRQFYLQVKMADVNLNQFGVQCPISNKVFALRSKDLMMAKIEISKTLKLDCKMEKIAPERKFGLFLYEDDIVFFSKKELESLHFKMIEINVAKMLLNVDEIQFLNFMVSTKSLDACLENVKAVQKVQALLEKNLCKDLLA
uniref:Reverse transcriptase domain-containing protein n=1 Tax=Strongyloides venezuelensis TaxID=75913 RepID=A0A0K0FGI7_STRVS